MVKRLIYNLKLRFYKWRLRKILPQHRVDIRDNHICVNGVVVEFPEGISSKEECRLTAKVDALRDTSRFFDPYDH
jgi:hypothetical protein